MAPTKVNLCVRLSHSQTAMEKARGPHTRTHKQTNRRTDGRIEMGPVLARTAGENLRPMCHFVHTLTLACLLAQIAGFPFYSRSTILCPLCVCLVLGRAQVLPVCFLCFCGVNLRNWASERAAFLCRCRILCAVSWWGRHSERVTDFCCLSASLRFLVRTRKHTGAAQADCLWSWRPASAGWGNSRRPPKYHCRSHPPARALQSHFNRQQQQRDSCESHDPIVSQISGLRASAWLTNGTTNEWASERISSAAGLRDWRAS